MDFFEKRKRELGISTPTTGTSTTSSGGYDDFFERRRRELLEGGGSTQAPPPSPVQQPWDSSLPMQQAINTPGGIGTILQNRAEDLKRESLPSLTAPDNNLRNPSEVTDKAARKEIESFKPYSGTKASPADQFVSSLGNSVFLGIPNQQSGGMLEERNNSPAGVAGMVIGETMLGGGAYGLTKNIAKNTLSNAPKLAQNAARGALAGATYGTAQELTDAALDTRMDGDQSLVQRALNVGKDAALFAAGDAAVTGLGMGITRGIKAVRERPLNNAINDFIKNTEAPSSNLGISPFAKQTGQKLRRPENPEQIKDLIDVGGRPAKEKNATWEKFYSSIVDEQAPLKRATEQMGGKNVPIEKSPYKTAWLSRGWKGKADSKIEYGFIDSAGNKTATSLKEAITPIKNRLDDWREYAVALRSKEYADVGLESGVPPELADRTIAKYANDQEIMKADQAIKDYVYNMNDDTLVQSGIWSKEKLDQYRQTQANYIPMFRTREKGIRDGVQGASAKSFGNVKDPTKKRTGSQSPIVDPLESIVKQTYKNQALAERNNVMRSIVELAEQSPENGLVTRVQNTKAIDEIQRSLDEFISTPSSDLEKQLTDALDLFKPHTVDGKHNVFTVMRNGKAEQWQINDDQLAKVVAGLGNEPSNPLINMVGKATGVLKAGLVLAPDFVLRNLVRDQMSAFINSKYGFIPLVDTVSGLISAARKDDAFYKWMSSGGANGSWVSLERDYLQGQIRDITQNGIKKMANPIEVLRQLSEWSEQGTRLGEFKRGLKKGASLKDAALASRDVTLDFSRIGSKTKSANKAIAFFNVAVQSMDKMARQFKDRPVVTPIKAALSITVPSVLLYALNHDKDEYQELPQWEKDAYWHVFMGDEIIKIPKPFEMGIVFGTFFERMMQSVKQDDPEAFKGFAKTVWEGFQPSVIPTLLEPWIETYANKDMFTKAPIVPKREEGLQPKDQFGPYTTELAKDLGGALNTSPRVIENYVKGYTGTLGGYGLQLADSAYRQVTGKQKNESPDYGLASTPGIKSFFSKGLEGSSKSVDEFYTELDKLRRERASSRNNNEMYKDEGKYSLYNSVADIISQYQKMSRLVQSDTSLSGEEKAERLKQINMQILNLARQAKGKKPIEE